MTDTPRQHQRHDLGLTIDLSGDAGSSVNISAGGISVSGKFPYRGYRHGHLRHPELRFVGAHRRARGVV